MWHFSYFCIILQKNYLYFSVTAVITKIYFVNRECILCTKFFNFVVRELTKAMQKSNDNTIKKSPMLFILFSDLHGVIRVILINAKLALIILQMYSDTCPCSNLPWGWTLFYLRTLWPMLVKNIENWNLYQYKLAPHTKLPTFRIHTELYRSLLLIIIISLLYFRTAN